MRISKELETQLKDKFDCPRCASRQATLELFSTPLDSQKSSDSDNSLVWVKLSCRRCSFSEIYNNMILDEIKVTRVVGEKVGQGYACGQCKNDKAMQFTILVKDGSGAGPNPLISRKGKYKTRVCDRCGYAEFYEVLKPWTGFEGLGVVRALEKLASEFQCKKCSRKGGITWFVDVTAEPLAEGFYRGIVGLVLVNCERCKFVEMHDRAIWEAQIE